MKKILVIEDNENNLYLITYILEKNRFEVINARDGKTGIQKAGKEKPDLIIMDIQLPDINGLEVARRLRASKDANTIPIVALTSYAMAGDEQKAIEAGCNGYIEKPIDPKTIMAEIKKYL